IEATGASLVDDATRQVVHGGGEIGSGPFMAKKKPSRRVRGQQPAERLRWKPEWRMLEASSRNGWSSWWSAQSLTGALIMSCVYLPAEPGQHLPIIHGEVAG